MDFKQITLGDIAVLLGVIAAFYAFYKMIKEVKKPREEKDKKIESELKEHKETLGKHEVILNEHTEKLNKIDNSLVEISGDIKESSEYTRESDELIKTALCSMQRQSLLNECEKYIKRGYATVEQKAAISSQYSSYHALGGNGFMTTLYEQVMNLPLEKGE
ncbi:MAG: hypothetical protein IJH65_04120 [Methanobrevibacter sp.]|nr:hypothetical protein [Methanobrevibacter sp.]